MLDNCTIIFEQPESLYELISGGCSFEWNKIEFCKQPDGSFTAHLTNSKAKLNIKTTVNQLRCKGSIHAYSNGKGNYAPVTLKQLQTGIDNLTGLFGVGKFERLEFGLSVPTADSSKILQLGIRFKGKDSFPMVTGIKQYGILFKCSKYSFKLYQKHVQTKQQHRKETKECIRLELTGNALYLADSAKLPERLTTGNVLQHVTISALKRLLLKRLESITAPQIDFSKLDANALKLVSIFSNKQLLPFYRKKVHRSNYTKMHRKYRQICSKFPSVWLSELQQKTAKILAA